MINIRLLRKVLETHIDWEEVNAGRYPVKGRILRISKRVTIKRKKKMILEKNSKGDIKVKRRNVIRIEIIE